MSSQPFSQFIGDFGNQSWHILFVNAKFDDTVAAYEELIGHPQTAVLPVSSGDHSYPPSGAVVEIKGSDWTNVFHLVGEWDEFDATALAKKLGTKIVTYQAEDTSGSTECALIAVDGTVTRMQTQADAESDDELMEEMDDYAAEMGIENAKPEAAATIAGYEEYFASLGIAVANISFNDDYSEVVVDAEDESKIGRVVRVAEPK